MSGKTIATSETKIEALKLQSSAYGVVIPLVYGVTQVSGNLIWYGGFKAVPHTTTQGGKGGIKSQSTSYSYQASVAMGLCHGVIAGIPRAWRGKQLFSGGVSAGQILVAVQNYAVPSSGGMAVALTNGATFVGMVQVTCDLGGDSGTNSLGLGDDYTVVGGTLTVLNEFYRVRTVQIIYQYTSGSVPVTALDEMGLSFKGGAIGQAQWSALSAWPTEAIAYSGLAYVAGQDYDLGTGAQVENHKFEIAAPMAYHLGSSQPDVDPSLMLRDVLTNGRAGASFPAEQLDVWTTWSNYCVAAGLLVSPAIDQQTSAAEIVRTAAELTNAGPVWAAGRLKMLPYADLAESGNGRTFTPNVTPVYELNDDHFSPRSGGAPPVRHRLKSSAERFNHVRVQFRNRATQYAVEIAEAKDETDIAVNGTRSAPIVNAPWVCVPAIAQRVAYNKMQRALHVCAEYEFQLPWHFALLEPMDLVTLTDTSLEMAQTPVRITVIEENADGDLAVTAEDYPAGTANAALYPSSTGAGYKPDYNAAPGNVANPVIFELPTQLATDTGLQMGVAVRGTDPNWGGAQVWCSLDGTNYQMVGTVYGAARYGHLNGPVGSTVDVTVQGTAQLLSGSAADAAALQTLCYIGGSTPEYFAFQTATLLGAGIYTLAGLVRGAYGTAATAHAAFIDFVRVDERVVRSQPLPLSLIGSTIYFKFCSFNVYGGGQQGLAEVGAFTRTITGAMALLRPADVAGLAAGGGPGAGRITWTPNTEGDYSETELRLGTSWVAGTLLARIKGSSYPWTIATAGTYTVWAKHRDALGNESANAASIGMVVDAFGAVVAGLQNYGQNLLPESDQMVAPKFSFYYTPNGATLGADVFHVEALGATTANYVLVGDRSRLVYIQQTGRHTGTADTGDSDGQGNTIAGVFGYKARIPVKPGTRVAVSCYGGSHRCRWRVAALFFDAAGAQLGTAIASGYVNSTENLTNTLDRLVRPEAVGVVPATAVTAMVAVGKYNTFAGEDNSFLFWGMPQFEVVAPNAEHASPYSSGPVGAIDTSQLVPGAATGIHLSTPTDQVTWAGGGSGFQGPVGGQWRRLSDVFSVTFTPVVTGSVFAEFNAKLSVTTPSGTDPVSGLPYAASQLEYGIRGGITASKKTTVHGLTIPVGTVADFGINISQRLDVTAGVSATVYFGIASLYPASSITAYDPELVVQEIRR